MFAGETLRQRLVREQRLPLKDALAIARELGGGSTTRTARVRPTGTSSPRTCSLPTGMRLLADFGIARAIFQAGGEHVTEFGLAIGTPEYMSPSRRGRSRAGRRCDEYALACVVYEMLAGERRFPETAPGPSSPNT